jgi:hypothetical protein
MHYYCNCEKCNEEWKSRNAYWETDDYEAPYKSRKKKAKTKKVKPFDKCRDSKNHLFVWVKFMHQNYRESKVFSWGYMMNVRYAEPGEFVSHYEFRCIGCGHIKKTAYPNRRWGNAVPAEYEIYEVRHRDKYGNRI